MNFRPRHNFHNVRTRAQGLVEYGLIAAAVALVGMAGLNALMRAETSYFTGLPLTAQPPDTSGALLHPTSVDVPVCQAKTPVKLGTSITCTTTVYDVYTNAFDRNPPMGTIDWLLDGKPINNGQCSGQDGASPKYLPALTTGAGNSCSVTFTPTGASMVGTHTLVAKYGRAAPGDPPWEVIQSNHYTSSSGPLSLQFRTNVDWGTTGCVNEVAPALGISVEIGHPMKCTAILRDMNSGAPVVPPIGTEVKWSTTNDGGSNAGVGMFTCAGSYADIWNPLTCPQLPIVSTGTPLFSCRTDATGQCSVIYRRLYDYALGGIGNATPLIAMALDDSYQVATLVVSQRDVHATGATVVCDRATPQDPNVAVVANALGAVSFGEAQFDSTAQVNVTGPEGDRITCTATIFDKVTDNPAVSNNPAVSKTADPTRDDAYPPMGMVTFNYTTNIAAKDLKDPTDPNYGTYKQTLLTECSLRPVPVDVSAATPPAQAPGQAPFMSTCGTPPNKLLTITGNGPQPAIVVEYKGEPGKPGDKPSHDSISFIIHVNYQPAI